MLVDHTVLAHAGLPPEPHDLPGAWSFEPAVLLGLALLGWAYGRGVAAVWGRAGVGRGVRRWQAAAFAAGLAALFVALVSPLDALGAALFAAHMLQHMLLVLVAALLFVLGAPERAVLWALPGPARGRAGAWGRAAAIRWAWRAITKPFVVWALHAAAIWAWHIPSLYQAALRNQLVHGLEHASFLGTGLLFWWVLARPPEHGGLDRGLGVLFLFTTALQSGVLGALMTFTPTPWYPAYRASTAAWGLTPLEDQQLAGLIMWVLGGLIYALAALALLGVCLSGSELDQQRREGQRPVR